MAILFPSRIPVVIFLLTATCGFSESKSIADERQPLLRYLGVGWGAGYHSYNPSSAIHAAHGFCWTDRYSRPANSGCIDCGGNGRGQNYLGNYGHYQGYGVQPAYGGPTNQQNPQPARRLAPTPESLPVPNNDSLPLLQDPPANSGSRQNPFGVTSNIYRQYIPVPSRIPSQGIQAQPRYRSAQQIQRVPSRSSQIVTPSNFKRSQMIHNLNNQIYRPQQISTNPSSRQQMYRNQHQPYQQSFPGAVQVNMHQRISSQYPATHPATHSNAGSSSVYRGIR